MLPFPSEADLLQGDAEAFAAFYRRREDALLGFAQTFGFGSDTPSAAEPVATSSKGTRP